MSDKKTKKYTSEMAHIEKVHKVAKIPVQIHRDFNELLSDDTVAFLDKEPTVLKHFASVGINYGLALEGFINEGLSSKTFWYRLAMATLGTLGLMAFFGLLGAASPYILIAAPALLVLIGATKSIWNLYSASQKVSKTEGKFNKLNDAYVETLAEEMSQTFEWLARWNFSFLPAVKVKITEQMDHLKLLHEQYQEAKKNFSAAFELYSSKGTKTKDFDEQFKQFMEARTALLSATEKNKELLKEIYEHPLPEDEVSQRILGFVQSGLGSIIPRVNLLTKTLENSQIQLKGNMTPEIAATLENKDALELELKHKQEACLKQELKLVSYVFGAGAACAIFAAIFFPQAFIPAMIIAGICTAGSLSVGGYLLYKTIVTEPKPEFIVPISSSSEKEKVGIKQTIKIGLEKTKNKVMNIIKNRPSVTRFFYKNPSQKEEEKPEEKKAFKL